MEKPFEIKHAGQAKTALERQKLLFAIEPRYKYQCVARGCDGCDVCK